MNQKEAVIEALQKLGGRAHLSDIYKFAYPLADWSGSQNWQNTLRWYLQKGTDTFRSPKRGWWELVSYQEEVAGYKKEISELKNQIAAKDKEIEELKKVKTEDEFVAKFVKKVKHNLKRDKKTVEEIRKLMDAVGRPDADKELDDWLQGKDTKVVKKVTKKYIQKNINSQVFTGNITESEFNGSEANEAG